MIKRYFYIFSTTLFILLSPTTGIKAKTLEKRLHAIERLQKAPPGFNYQAALRDAEGEILANTEVTLQFSIQTAADGGTVHWIETHTVTTNAQGLVSVVIGEGTQTGGEQTTFDAIPFGDSDMFLKVDVDTGTGFTTMGTEQLQSVPYAMVAENGLTTAQITKLDALDANAEQNVQADWNETNENSDAYIQNKPNISGGGSVQADWAVTNSNSDAYIANKPDFSNFDQNAADDFDGAFDNLTGIPSGLEDGDDVNDADASATNELQSLDFTDQIISISGDPAATPTTIDLSNFDQDATDDFNGAFESLSGVPAGLSDGDDVNDADANATNEIQDLDFTSNVISLSGDPTPTSIDLSAFDQNASDDLTTTDLAFTTADNLTSNSNGDLANDSFVFGSTSMDDVAGTDDDTRMFFDKSNGSFRVGSTDYTQWNIRGLRSFAAGTDNTASGNYSFAGGGFGNTISGATGFIGAGVNNTITADESVVVGGGSNTASGSTSFVGGGILNQANGSRSSVSGGYFNLVSGDFATIPGGQRLTAESRGQISMGVWNTPHPGSPNATNFISTDRLLVVGNGLDNDNRSDALVMLKNGDVTFNGSITIDDDNAGALASWTLPGQAPDTDGYVMQANIDGTTSWVDPSGFSSDRRLKTNIRDISNVFEKLSKVEGYRFNWNEVQNRDTEREEIGFIAQEVQELYPELVSVDDQGYLRVKYISFVPLLLEAVKELQERNAKLVAENDALEVRQAKDEERFAKLEGQLKLLMQQMLPAEAVGKD